MHATNILFFMNVLMIREKRDSTNAQIFLGLVIAIHPKK
jgi:hypothetical protein